MTNKEFKKITESSKAIGCRFDSDRLFISFDNGVMVEVCVDWFRDEGWEWNFETDEEKKQAEESKNRRTESFRDFKIRYTRRFESTR